MRRAYKAKGHGLSGTRMFSTWKGMMRRCDDLRADSYKWYGGKGIKVCKEWRDDFMVFRAWALSHGYTDKLQIDRVDSSRDYEPSNCRWSTCKENIRNKSKGLRYIEYQGKRMIMKDWADMFSIQSGTLQQRLNKGWEIGEALTTPTDTRLKYITHKGVRLHQAEWERQLDMKKGTLKHRFMSGWSVEKAMNTPVRELKISDRKSNNMSNT